MRQGQKDSRSFDRTCRGCGVGELRGQEWAPSPGEPPQKRLAGCKGNAMVKGEKEKQPTLEGIVFSRFFYDIED